MARGWLVGAVLLAAWYGVLSTREAGLYEGVPPFLHLLVPAASALVTAVLAPRRKILLGASLAVIPAVFVAMVTARSSPSMIEMVPSGPRAAPFFAVGALMYAAIPCTVGAAIGALLTRRARNVTN